VQRKGCIVARGSAQRNIVHAFLCHGASKRATARD
jgi:hypothetical protein